MHVLRIIPFLALTLLADSPLIPSEKPVSHGRIGAGEGPAWDGKGNLYFTGEGRIRRRDSSGKVETIRENAGANGLLFDRQGRLVACDHQQRRVTRTERDGSLTVLADGYEGKKLNSPNDLTMDSKGRIYFSDPRYGNRDSMEMRDASGRAIEGVYRIDAPGKITRIITHEVDRPNGLLVSPKDEYLYVADNNNNTVGGASKLWRFHLRADGSVDPATRKLIFDWGTARGPDGFKMDREGRLYVAAGRTTPKPPYETADKYKGGVYILSAEGKLIDFVAIPDDEVTNVAFGGADWKTLFITAGGNLWSLKVNTPGWQQGPRPGD
jgi:gluconolactonase